MLDVFYTVDVEVWCDGWNDIDRKFADCFRRYIYGPTAQGDFGLAYQASLLREHGLTGVFYTEPLFSLRFGRDPLAEVVGLIREAEQEVQLHLHTEWVDEAREPPVECVDRKRHLLSFFNRADQRALIELGRQLLVEAGCPLPSAFRAGNFGFNGDTVLALSDLRVGFDSSYNAACLGVESGIRSNGVLLDVTSLDDVIEFPVTVFSDGLRSYRPVQIGSVSWDELEALLWQAAEQGRRSFTIVSHNFELMAPSLLRVDDVVNQRFRRLCAFLDRHRTVFRTRGFDGLTVTPTDDAPEMLSSPIWRTALRIGQQAYRRRWR